MRDLLPNFLSVFGGRFIMLDFDGRRLSMSTVRWRLCAVKWTWRT